MRDRRRNRHVRDRRQQRPQRADVDARDPELLRREVGEVDRLGAGDRQRLRYGAIHRQLLAQHADAEHG